MNSQINAESQNLEINVVQGYLSAFGQNNTAEALQYIHPNAVWHIDGDPIVKTVGIIQGHQAIKQWLEDFPQAFKPLTFSITQMFSAEQDVLVVGRFRHLVLATQTIVDSDYIIKFTLQEAKIIRYQIFEDSLLLSHVHNDSSPSRQITINTTTYAWNDTGNGAAIIYLHGLFLDRNFWRPIVQALPGYRHICFDLPGHGESGWRDQLNLDAIAQDIVLWIQEYGIEKVTLVGHSQGGMIAMRIAAQHPALITHLILMNTSAREEYPERLLTWREREKILLSNSCYKQELFKEIQQLKYGQQDLNQHQETREVELTRLMTANHEHLAKALAAAVLHRADLRKQITTIQAKTYVLSGAMDTATPIELGAEIAQLIPNAIHQVLPQATHSIPSESPQIICNILNHIHES